jgi:hypothetical protein
MKLFCPICLGEHREGFTFCEECNEKLVPFENLPVILPCCPLCKTKYPIGTAFCKKCLAELVIEEKEKNLKNNIPNPEGEIITIYESSSLTELALIKGALAKAQIDFNVKGEIVQNVFSFGLYGEPNPVTGGITIEVQRTDAAFATEIIREIVKP